MAQAPSMRWAILSLTLLVAGECCFHLWTMTVLETGYEWVTPTHPRQPADTESADDDRRS